MSRGNRSRPAHERTAEERLRDREQRERRRAGTPEVRPAVIHEPELEQELASQPAAPVPVQPLPPVASQAPPEPPPATEHEAPIEPAEPIEPLPPTHADLSVEPLPPAGAAPGSDPPVEPQPPPVAPAPPPAAVPALPLPAPRAARQEPLQRRSVELGDAPRAADAAGSPPRGRGRGRGRARRPSRAGGPGRGGGRRVTRARIGALIALVAAAALVWFLLSLFQPFAGEGNGRVIVTIPKGSSSSKIGSILAHEGVVSSGFFFNVRATLEGKRSALHSGRFQLKHDMSYSAAIDALSKPPPRVIAVTVVIPEGYTRRQIADLVSEDALTGSYLAASKRSPLLNPAHYGAPAGTPDLEGFLFPATYDMTAGAPVTRLVGDQLRAFRERFTADDVRRAHALGVTPYQLLTVASMIEREAQTEHDRPRIAAVIYNRLREGIPLGIDATIYYAVEQQKGIATYTGELTESQLKIDSPYNTRTHKGLPPTPISNPGEASINAAAHPSRVPYLYYVAGADGCGEQVFSKTYAEFQKNVDAYDAAVKKHGGHPPACKKK